MKHGSLIPFFPFHTNHSLIHAYEAYTLPIHTAYIHMHIQIIYNPPYTPHRFTCIYKSFTIPVHTAYIHMHILSIYTFHHTHHIHSNVLPVIHIHIHMHMHTFTVTSCRVTSNQTLLQQAMHANYLINQS